MSIGPAAYVRYSITRKFDLACTNADAELLARVRKAGGEIETAGACIAAVAVANGFSIATRDSSPFRAGGLTVINPWEDM